ncbi:MAG: glycosyltransferase family 4 protein, partial [Candidatus Sulfotelmatobacter sp.]
YLASWAAAYWARIHRVPLLLWSESTAFDLRGRYRVVEFMKMHFLRMCSGFVVPGTSSLNYLKDLGIEEQLIFTARNAVDTSLFSSLAEAARRDESQVRSRYALPQRYFLYVGRMVKEKGIFDLLDAYGQLEPDLRSKVGLVFVGDGPDLRQLVQRAAKTPGTIQFPGFVHREQLPEIYALADGSILPTHSDPWGLVVNEAMACNLPVIVTSVAGCALDLVTNDWNGFIVSPCNIGQLAAAMESLATDSGRRFEMGRRSRQRVDAYSPAAWAEGMVNAVQFIRATAQ